MRVLITGCCGFIGSHLVEYLLTFDNMMVFGIDQMTRDEDYERKKTNLKILQTHKSFVFIEDDICRTRAISELKPEYIIHLAGLAGVRKSLSEPEKYVYNNIYGHTYLLKEAIANNVKKFIYASSSSVYGENRSGQPFEETNDIINVQSPYAWSKWSNEKISEIYKNTGTSLEIIGCRFFSVYGPRGRPDMAPFKFFQRVMNGEMIEIYGDGSQKRDFTYVKDVVRSLHKIMISSKKLSSIYNIGYGNPITILELVRIIEKILNKNANIIYKPKNNLDVSITFCNNSKLFRDIQYKPDTCTEKGIQHMISYHLTKIFKE